ncbi:MAG TPA: transposase [Bacillota bacterium]|nr:transposase [Bacillota bacterium]
MKPQKVLYHWGRSVGKAFPHLSKPQVFVLAAFSLGVAWAKSCSLSRIAQSLAILGTLPTVERRLQRFLSNPRIDPHQGSVCLAQWVVPSVVPALGRLAKPLVLLVDETALNEYLKVMTVALAYRGRALPLAWWCYPQTQYPLPQVDLIDTLLGQVAPALPAGTRVLVEADRGLSCSAELMERVLRHHWYFLFRVQGRLRLALSEGREVTFRDLVPKPGRCWSQAVKVFKQAGGIPCRALGYWKVGQEEPWLLLTNWPGATTAGYALRMWEEHAFRDLKSNGFNWQKSRVRQAEHANRLWLILALAYAWGVSLGTWVLEQAPLWRQVARGAKERISVLKLGLRWLARSLQLGLQLIYEPHLNPQFMQWKTVVY